VRTTPLFRLEFANRKLARKRPAVATPTVVSPRENRRFDPRGTVSFGTAESVLSDSGLT
jgi:hypothetical protein